MNESQKKIPPDKFFVHLEVLISVHFSSEQSVKSSNEVLSMDFDQLAKIYLLFIRNIDHCSVISWCKKLSYLR